jgi:hypothetical protein
VIIRRVILLKTSSYPKLLIGELAMTVLIVRDFLADIQFIDYKDAEFLLNDAVVESSADIHFVDYWDAEFLLNNSDADVSSGNWDVDVSLDDWSIDV